MLSILSLTLLCAFPQFAFAAEADTQNKSQVKITVVMPDITPTPAPTPSPPPTPIPPIIPSLYPSSIEESEDNGARRIVKTYELSAAESPKDIPRDGFTRDGWDYEIADITKTETADTDKQDHTETVKVNTDTKDTEAILKQLAPTMEYTSEDGYAGTLTLDIASIKVETAGTQTSSYTVSATREYPNLSNEDTSLVPKTITDGGRTLKLANVEWHAQTIDGIDGNQIPSSYTAVAKYTGTGSKTVITGYVTTADYIGSISKTSAGKTVYKAIFIGTEIKPVPIPFVSTDEAGLPCDSATQTGNTSVESTTPAPTAAATEEATATATPETETPSATDTIVTAPAASQTPSSTAVEKQDKPASPWPIVFIMAIVMILLNGVAYYFLLRKKSAPKPDSTAEPKTEPKPETEAKTKDEASSKDDDANSSS